MRALIYDGKSTKIKEIPVPKVDNDFNVLIKVLYSGICKTDVYVSLGKINCNLKYILLLVNKI